MKTKDSPMVCETFVLNVCFDWPSTAHSTLRNKTFTETTRRLVSPFPFVLIDPKTKNKKQKTKNKKQSHHNSTQLFIFHSFFLFGTCTGDALIQYESVGAELCENPLFNIQPGDRVGICMRNYPELLVSFLAITAAGGVAIPLNAMWGTDVSVLNITS